MCHGSFSEGLRARSARLPLRVGAHLRVPLDPKWLWKVKNLVRQGQDFALLGTRATGDSLNLELVKVEELTHAVLQRVPTGLAWPLESPETNLARTTCGVEALLLQLSDPKVHKPRHCRTPKMDCNILQCIAMQVAPVPCSCCKLLLFSLKTSRLLLFQPSPQATKSTARISQPQLGLFIWDCHGLSKFQA